VQREAVTLTTSEQGGVAVSLDAIAQIVRSAALESYGVVGLAGRRRFALRRPWRDRTKAIDVRMGEGGLAIELHVVVEHGLKLAEVAAAVRSRIEYELERMLGLPIADLNVRIERVR
jgi:uncharacterized alkaline shock family protein YloU